MTADMRANKGKLVALSAFTLLLAGLAGASAFASMTRFRAPSLTLQVAPGDGAALAANQEDLFRRVTTSANLSGLRAVSHTARSAIEDTPFNPVAIRQLGYGLIATGDEARGNALLVSANRLTRRDLWTQLWLIERAVERADLQGAVSGYVSAMNVNTESWSLLFPALASALGDARVRAAFVGPFRKDAPWVPGFVSYAMNNGTHALPVYQLIKASGGLPRSAQQAGLGKTILRVLVERRAYAEASAFYKSMPASVPNILTSASFLDPQQNEMQAPMGWQLQDALSYGAMIDGSGYMTLFAEDTVRGVAASKILFLNPGQYDFRRQYGQVDLPTSAFVKWSLTCLLTGGASRAIFNGMEERPRISAIAKDRVEVQPDCAAQKLDVLIAGGLGRNRSEVTVESVSIRPIGAKR